MLAAAEPQEQTGAVRPSGGLIVARGAGWGALFGAATGVILPTPFLVASDGMDGGEVLVAAVLLGVLVMPLGALVGALGGVAAGVATVGLRARWSSERPVARVASALVGGAAVLGATWFIIRPDFEVGPNETTRHVVDDVLLVVGPAVVAALLGLVFGPLLVRDDPTVDAGGSTG